MPLLAELPCNAEVFPLKNIANSRFPELLIKRCCHSDAYLGGFLEDQAEAPEARP